MLLRVEGAPQCQKETLARLLRSNYLGFRRNLSLFFPCFYLCNLLIQVEITKIEALLLLHKQSSN